MNSLDLIPHELLIPPVSTGQRFDTWKRFALYCAPLSVLFAGLLTAFLYFLWQAINANGNWLWVIVMGLLCGGDAGLIWSLQDALMLEHERDNKLLKVYQENHVVIRAHIRNLNIGELNIQARKGSSVNIGNEAAPTESPAQLAQFRRHFSEFYELVASGNRDINRDSWLSHTTASGHKMPAFQWNDGERATREEYDTYCDMFKTMGLVEGRKKGSKGTKTTPLLEETAK